MMLTFVAEVEQCRERCRAVGLLQGLRVWTDRQTDAGLLSLTGVMREGESGIPKRENDLKENSEISHSVLSYEI